MGPTRGGIEDWLREQRRKIPCVEMLFACVGAKGLEESPAVEALGDKIRQGDNINKKEIILL
jgi:hypothetical protein